MVNKTGLGHKFQHWHMTAQTCCSHNPWHGFGMHQLALPQGTPRHNLDDSICQRLFLKNSLSKGCKVCPASQPQGPQSLAHHTHRYRQSWRCQTSDPFSSYSQRSKNIGRILQLQYSNNRAAQEPLQPQILEVYFVINAQAVSSFMLDLNDTFSSRSPVESLHPF